MAKKTIIVAAFPYTDSDGVSQTALRGDEVTLEGRDLERGERLGAFATDEDLKDGSPFAEFLASREASTPAASVELDPAEVEGRKSPAGSADPAIQSGMVTPTGGESSPPTAERSARTSGRSNSK